MAANGLVWMTQVLKFLCLIYCGRIVGSTFSHSFHYAPEGCIMPPEGCLDRFRLTRRGMSPTAPSMTKAGSAALAEPFISGILGNWHLGPFSDVCNPQMANCVANYR